MATDEKCPCDAVKQLRQDFIDFKIDTNNKIDSVTKKNQVLEVKFATIDTKLNFLIGGVTILAVAVAAVVVPMIFK